MDDSVENFLAAQKADGELDSEGAFRVDLSEARRKLSEFGQTDPLNWTLQFAQAFCALGCARITVHSWSDRWFLEVPEETPTPFSSTVGTSVPEFNFNAVKTPAEFLLLGLCGLTALGLSESYWLSRDSHLTLLGGQTQPEQTKVRDRCGLLLVWSARKAPPFPRALWSQRLSFFPRSVYCGAERISRRAGSKALLESHNLLEPHWLEYLVSLNSAQHFQIVGSGRPFYERKANGETKQIGGSSGAIRVRWWEESDSDLPREQIVVFARGGLFGPTRFHPVKLGCLLEPFYHFEYPEGFEIYFSADDLDTDISQLSLLDTDARTKRLTEITPVVLKAVAIMYKIIESTQLMARAPRTPLVADLAPGSLSALAAGALLLYGFSLGSIVLSTLLAGPAIGYFWVSRKFRRQEFESLRDITLTALENKRAALRAFCNKYRANSPQSVE